jgi:hypothetical protein
MSFELFDDLLNLLSDGLALLFDLCHTFIVSEFVYEKK